MSWFKVDDRLHSSRKLIKIPRKHRLAALGLWTLAGSWSADQETDGLIPDYMIEEWGGTKLLVELLVKAELWEKVGDDAQFRKWAEYQPTKAEKEAEREKNREKLRKWREAKRQGNDGSNQDVTGLHPGYEPGRNPSPVPSRPDPTPLKEEDSSSDAASGADGEEAQTTAEAPKQYAPEVHELCHYLAGWIVRNGNRTPTVGAQWLQACDRLIRLDNVRPDQIRAAIDWCQQDPFWQGNILSMPKLREKYDQLRAAAQRPTNQQHGGQPRPSATQTRLTTGQTMVERLKAKEEQRAQAEQAPLLQIGETA